mmetsp:Transcript_808/g.3210  ORF Transcript_808/g.3210 Transcript_808/m.3210 type:complete len:251 (-) Transcript_808:212-964(-)
MVWSRVAAVFTHAARRRDAGLSRLVDGCPAAARVARALPAKTLALLTCAGTLSVIFATDPRITLWTFGASCCAVAAACLTLGLRAPVDEDIVATFAPIMLGTLRQKMRTLHVIFQALGASFALLGAASIAAARAHDDAWRWSAAVRGVLGTPHDAVAAVAAVLLFLQVASLARGDDYEESVGYFAHDAVCAAQILVLLTDGIDAMATTLVAVLVCVLWCSNAVQVHHLYGTPVSGNEDAHPTDVSVKFSV